MGDQVSFRIYDVSRGHPVIERSSGYYLGYSIGARLLAFGRIVTIPVFILT